MINAVVCQGIHCRCLDCGKVWTITAKDISHCKNVNNIIDQMNTLDITNGLSCAINGNVNNAYQSLKVGQAGTYAYANYASRNINTELLQCNHCPDCRGFNINIDVFYYLADRNLDFIEYTSKDNYDKYWLDVKSKLDQNAKQNQKNKTFWFWVSFFTIGLLLYYWGITGLIQALLYRRQVSNAGFTADLVCGAIIGQFVQTFLIVQGSQIAQLMYLLVVAVIHIVFHSSVRESYYNELRPK